MLPAEEIPRQQVANHHGSYASCVLLQPMPRTTNRRINSTSANSALRDDGLYHFLQKYAGAYYEQIRGIDSGARALRIQDADANRGIRTLLI
jgi:hypothetical protein